MPPILDVTKLDRKMLVSNEESVAGLRAAARRGRGSSRGVSSGAVVHVARRIAAELDEGVVVCRARRRRLEVPLGRLLDEAARARSSASMEDRLWW